MNPLLLLFLLLNPESTSTSPVDSTGLSFIVVFPENIAYYHPLNNQNQVHITAFYDNTEVTIMQHTYQTSTDVLGAGETRVFDVNEKLELRERDVSNRILRITSTKKIIVQAFSLKSSSIQTALILPTNKLAREFLVPPIPQIPGTPHPEDVVSPSLTDRGPFRIIVVNADQENEVTIGEAQARELQPYQSIQIFLKAAVRVVKTKHPAVVLFGHTCSMWQNCSCGMLNMLLPPSSDKKLRFFIPPVLVKGFKAETVVLVSEKQSNRVEAFNPDSPLVETSGSAILYRPGMLLALIPETDFASCFVVNFIPNMENFAVILVHKDLTDGIHIRQAPLESPVWEELKGTKYVSALVKLPPGKSIIWHASSKMAIYYIGRKMSHFSVLFGNPAPVVSNIPDFRGCVLIPEVLKIGEVADGWRESVKYCRNNNLELISFPSARLQQHIYRRIVQVKNDSLQEAWIGLRRSSLTGDWYWLNKTQGNNKGSHNWAKGEPGTLQDGQCVVMSLESSEDFGWSDKDCCQAARPICYKKPRLVNESDDDNST